MEKSFYLFDQDFNETSDLTNAIYIVITDVERDIFDGELYDKWHSSFKDELRNIDTGHSYYVWNDDEETYEYISCWEEDLICKLHDLTQSLLTPTEKMECASEVGVELNSNPITKKYTLTITLENGTVVEPNFTSDNPADFSEMIKLLTSDIYFAGNIKSIHIE